MDLAKTVRCVYCEASIPDSRIKRGIAMCPECGGTFQLGGRRTDPTRASRRSVGPAPSGVSVLENPLRITVRPPLWQRLLGAVGAPAAAAFVLRQDPELFRFGLAAAFLYSGYAIVHPFPISFGVSEGHLRVKSGLSGEKQILVASVGQLSVHEVVRSREVRRNGRTRLEVRTTYALRADVGGIREDLAEMKSRTQALFLEELLESQMGIRNEHVLGGLR